MLEIYSSTVNKELQGIHTGIFNPLTDKSGLGVYDLFIHFISQNTSYIKTSICSQQLN